MTIDAAEQSDPYDVPLLMELCMGDAEMAEELLDRFVSRLDAVRLSLETCLGQGDRTAAAAIAHSLKGEAGMLAAGRLHALAAELERSLRLDASPGQQLGDLLTQLQSELAQCVQGRPAARDAVFQLQSLQP